jgi:hypothetical protein
MKTNDVLLMAAVLGVGYLALRTMRVYAGQAQAMRALYTVPWNPLNGAPLIPGDAPAGTRDYI